MIFLHSGSEKGGQLMGPSFRGQGRRDSALSGTNLKVVKEMGGADGVSTMFDNMGGCQRYGASYRVEPKHNFLIM
jgi:hypothetical protein